MTLLNDEIRDQVTELLAGLDHPVRLLVFTTPEDCQYCDVIVELTQEVAATSEQVAVEVYDVTKNAAIAAEFAIDKTPAIAFIGKEDYGLRFFGIPAQHEFTTLIHGIQAVGHGHAHLDEATASFLAELQKPVLMRVFVTPGCPYCPPMAAMAYDMAVASSYVRAEVVEASEFPELAQQFDVMGVPLSVINEQVRVEGSVPAEKIVDAIKSVL